jgi:hypothetical protein
MRGYRAGVIQVDSDIKTKFDTTGIDANQEHIKCPEDSSPVMYCFVLTNRTYSSVIIIIHLQYITITICVCISIYT